MSASQTDFVRRDLEAQSFALNRRLQSTVERWKDINHLLVSTTQKSTNKENPLQRVPLSRFLSAHGISEDDLQVEQGLVFVLTPYHPDFGSIFNAIRETCHEMGLKCYRGDEEYVVGDLLPHLLRLLVRAQMVIAVIDGRNPNVFYELGIAHALDKATILVTRSPEETPFDVRAKRLIFYARERVPELPAFRKALKDELEKTLAFVAANGV